MSEHVATDDDPRVASATPSFERYGGTAAENYERYFVPAIGGPLATDLTEVAALDAGERALDVACGTGIVARLAAERVGPTGSVDGLDVNPGMLAVARSVAPPGAAIEWHQSDAQALPFPEDAYDAALCQMGLQFLPTDPRRCGRPGACSRLAAVWSRMSPDQRRQSSASSRKPFGTTSRPKQRTSCPRSSRFTTPAS